jgi:hypothetical protein
LHLVCVKKNETTHERIKNILLAAKLQGSSQDISPKVWAYMSTTTGTEKIIDIFLYVTGSVGSDAEPEGHKCETDAQTSSQAKTAHFNVSSVGGFCLSDWFLYL